MKAITRDDFLKPRDKSDNTKYNEVIVIYNFVHDD